MTKRLLVAGTGLLSLLFPACAGLLPRDNPPPIPGTIVYERKPWQHSPAVAAIPTSTSGMMVSSITGQSLDPARLNPPLARRPAPADPNSFAIALPSRRDIDSDPRREVAVRSNAETASETLPIPRTIVPREVSRPDWPSFVRRAAPPETERASSIRVVGPDEAIPTAESIAAQRPRTAIPPAPPLLPERIELPVRAPEASVLPPLLPPPLRTPVPAPPEAIVPSVPRVEPLPEVAVRPGPSMDALATANSRQTETILVRIIRAFQENRPQEAIDILNGVDPQNRDLLIFLVPIVTELSERQTSTPSQEDLGAMADRLQEALLTLRSKAPLRFETTCYATRIDGYGRYARADTSTFAPGSRTQLYLELRNLSWLPGVLPPQKGAVPQKGFLLHLVCQIELQDARGRTIWQSESMERRDFRQTVPGDYHLSPSFGVPDSLAPGAYKLAVRVEDRPTGRTVRKTLDFLVSGERK